MANNCLRCDTLAKNAPVNSEKYAAALSVLFNWNNPHEEHYQEKSIAMNNTSLEECKASSENNFYLEELEKYTFSVWCIGNAKSQLEPVIEHLVRRQGQPRGAQMQAVHLSDQKGWSRDPPIPRFHLRFVSGDKGLLLEIHEYPRLSEGLFIILFLCVCSRCSHVKVKLFRRVAEHFHFGVYATFSELGAAHWRSWDFWMLVMLVLLLWFLRLYLHYCSQWLFLQTISVPVTKFKFFPHTVELCYQNSLLQTSEELVMVVVGPLTLNAGLILMVLIRWVCQQRFDSFPSFLSKFIIALGLWTVLDPLAVFIVDSFLGRLSYSVEKPIADAAKLYWVFLRSEESGVPGALITVMLYTVLFIISSTVLYLYFLRLHSEGWLLDVFRRIHGEEDMFFVPLDLEISIQELSYIIKRAEQWRGSNGERRMVAVYDYIWKDHGSHSGVSSCDLQPQDAICNSRGTTVHVSVYTVHLSGFQQLYRQFLRLPDGAVIEAFGDIPGISLLGNEVSTAQEHISETDSVLHTSSHIELRERKKSTAKGNPVTSDKK
ncbi:uncharacterized protein LOC136058885 [Cyrtonyx montezumae]|uniref:uncharacterized protein LOC136058885 n=1 Tax=Cyrtonyx montezumae TaxID=9017 RepID=UPI0032DB1C33